MADKLLDWLDKREEFIKQKILRDFRTKVNLFENFIDLVGRYTLEIYDKLPTFADEADLKYSGDTNRLCRIVSWLLLLESLERLYATRRMLLSGYQGRMLACLRDMGEAIYYSDICLQSQEMSIKWLNSDYLPTPKKLKDIKINDRVRKYREGSKQKFFSGLVHPTKVACERAILYKVPVISSLSTEAENLLKNGTHDKVEKEQTYINIWMVIFSSYDFLKYLRDTYPSIYENNTLIQLSVNKLNKRFHQHVVILGKQLRGEQSSSIGS